MNLSCATIVMLNFTGVAGGDGWRNALAGIVKRAKRPDVFSARHLGQETWGSAQPEHQHVEADGIGPGHREPALAQRTAGHTLLETQLDAFF